MLRIFLIIGLLFPAIVASAQENPALNAQKAAENYIAMNERAILAEYMTLLSYPNYGGNDADIRAAAAHIMDMMAGIGVEAELLENDGPPVIYGELMTPGAEKTIVLYVHYDGQPVDRSLWASDPFVSVIRDGRYEDGAEIINLDETTGPINPDWRVYARSASDDKAPIIGIISAIRAMREAGIPLSVNLKFFFEGEEEMGSPNLLGAVERYRDRLDADYWLFLDGPRDQRGNPRVILGVRGSYGVQLSIYGPATGLHSGHYGNFAPNPVARLAHILANMRNEEGRILIPGFYDDVPEPSAAMLDLIDALPEADAEIMQQIGVASREYPGMSYEEALLYPALNYRGIYAGGVNEQSRNVIVPKATASIGFRLVPDQTPERITALVNSYLEDEGHYLIFDRDPTMEERLEHSSIIRLDWSKGGYGAVRTQPTEPTTAALISVMKDVTDNSVLIYPSTGGSLPLAHIAGPLSVPLVTLPIANADNNQHAPNENIRLGHLFEGIGFYAAVLADIGNR